MYRIVPDLAADEQVERLPEIALLGYAEALALLEIAPQRGHPYNAALPDGPMRQIVFGPSGQGIVTYLVLDEQREVHVLLVDWIDLDA